jgi:hypothetical protein|nr:MAG TPA_asm: Exonuclease [Caudoviricetes sp.]
MIKNHDRSGWFGASDTYTIMCAGRNTESFAKWWAQKLGITHNSFTTPAMAAGTAYEHRILDALGIRKKDRQIKIRRLRLRVNLDGEDKYTVHEVKTHSADKPFTVSRAYWMQCQVEMFATGKKCVIDAYALLPEDYENYYNPIDPNRLEHFPVEYDKNWIESKYLPELEYFADCLKKKIIPGGR